MRLLDLFCGAGGAGMGYHRAGFEVVGVDNRRMPRYPFEFHQADALEYVREHGHEFDAIHASPPCQAYSRLRHLPWLRENIYPELIPATREALIASGKPWVIENVEGAPLGKSFPSFSLSGQQLGMPDLLRSRRFETSFLVMVPCVASKAPVICPGSASQAKRYRGGNAGITGVTRLRDYQKGVSRQSVAGHFSGVARARRIMDIDWMTRDELSQAIPPAYTSFIGRALLDHIRAMTDAAGAGK